MDNEEIRKLLQELKESSDESSAVRSKVVKIHMDTPEEAERRQRAKEREREKEARKKAQELAKQQAEEDAKRLEAERAAKRVVEEAKAQAKAGFAADLDEAIMASDTLFPDPDKSGEEADDLNLSWEYEKPELKSGFVKEEDLFLEGEQQKEKERFRRPEEGEDDLSEEDFDSDENAFRTGEEGENASLTGLPGAFGALSDKVLSFIGSVGSSVRKDLTRGKGRRGEDSEDLDAPEETGEPEDGEAAEKTEVPEQEEASEPAKTDGMQTPEREYGPDEDWKRRMEEAGQKKSRFRRKGPKKESRFGFLSGKKEKTSKKSAEEKALTEEEEPASGTQDADTDHRTEKADAPAAAPALGTEKADAPAAAPDPETEKADALVSEMDALTQRADALASGTDSQPDDADPSAKRAADLSEEESSFPEHAASESGKDSELQSSTGKTPDGAKASVKSIELIDLNENQNNKDAELIPLVGDTGALPDPAELKKAGAKKHFFREGRKKRADRKKDSTVQKKDRTAQKKDNTAQKKDSTVQKKGAAVRDFVLSHRKQCIIAAAAAAVVLALIIGIVIVLGHMKNARREQVEADEGLSVRILKQPDSYAKEGDVQIRIKAPETIQSVTINGENVVVNQGRSVDLSYHATGGTLDLMAVSTDKVRNAKIILAYVDSQPPVVTIKEEDGRIALSAEDTESGLDAIYIGDTSGLSDIPQYVRYSETLEMNPDKEISYYAVDHAGNATTPVTVALTPAESISFERDSYGMFPGSVERVNLITTPANAFVNNLTLEAENPKIVQVEGDMQIRAMAEGDTKITATADGIAGVMANVSVAGQRKVRISAIGDCTLGTDVSFSQNNSFTAFEALYGDSYFFEKVKGILGSDDSTFANLEGTLTTSDQRAEKQFAFKGDPSYTQILQDGSIDVVSLANNHTKDYGEAGLADTKNALESAGIEWCEGDHIAWRDLNGVRTAYIGIYALENGLDTLPQVKSTVAQAKKEGADLIIVEFHWGAELVAEVDSFQKELAHTAVDEGANLVLGSHAHVLQGIEKYNGAYIVYGLGNFCFGGNSNPASYDTMIWQQTFTFTADGLESEDDISIIPCRISGDTSSNNYQPVPVSGDAAASIMQTIDSLSASFGQSYSRYMVDGTLWTES